MPVSQIAVICATSISAVEYAINGKPKEGAWDFAGVPAIIAAIGAALYFVVWPALAQIMLILAALTGFV